VASGHAHAKRIQPVPHHPNIQPSTAAGQAAAAWAAWLSNL